MDGPIDGVAEERRDERAREERDVFTVLTPIRAKEAAIAARDPFL